MKKKYELTDQVKILDDGTKVYRIRALRDFGEIKKGDLGGFIKKESNLSHRGTCWVADEAIVKDEAKIKGNAHVCDNAVICNKAELKGMAIVAENAQIGGMAMIYGNAIILRNPYIKGHAKIYGDSIVSDQAKIEGKSKVYNNASVADNVHLKGNIKICGDSHIARNFKNRTIKGNIKIFDNYIVGEGVHSKTMMSNIKKRTQTIKSKNCFINYKIGYNYFWACHEGFIYKDKMIGGIEIDVLFSPIFTCTEKEFNEIGWCQEQRYKDYWLHTYFIPKYNKKTNKIDLDINSAIYNKLKQPITAEIVRFWLDEDCGILEPLEITEEEFYFLFPKHNFVDMETTAFFTSIVNE